MTADPLKLQHSFSTQFGLFGPRTWLTFVEFFSLGAVLFAYRMFWEKCSLHNNKSIKFWKKKKQWHHQQISDVLTATVTVFFTASTFKNLLSISKVLIRPNWRLRGKFWRYLSWGRLSNSWSQNVGNCCWCQWFFFFKTPAFIDLLLCSESFS